MQRNWRNSLSDAARPRGESGFTLIELMIWAGVAISVIIAATASYVGTTRSWDGTAALARIQRDGSLAVEMMARGIRSGSTATVGSAGDSLNVYYWTGSTDSLIARYYLDGQGNIRDLDGFEVATDVDSLRFGVSSGKVVNIDIYLRDDRETEDHAGDDLPVSLSSTAVCRN